VAIARAARRGVGPSHGPVIPGGYYGGFYPWGYGGYGFGGYYDGFYDPWGYGSYGVGGSGQFENASLHLKVKPRSAQVFVDGFYAGVVDEFDGVFQKLHLTPGPHHITISGDGYGPLEFDIEAQPGKSITYRGELQKEL